MKKLVTLVSVFSLLLASSFTPATQAPAVQPGINMPSVSGGEPLPHPQTIYVKTRIDGTVQYIPLLVFFNDKVLWVKSQFADILDIPMESFDLTYKGAVMDENLTLNDYRVTPGTYLGAVYY